MNDNEKQFEDFIRDLNFDDTADLKHRDKLEQDILSAVWKRPRQTKIWSTIMKSQISKLALAAAVVLAVAISVTLLDKSASSAWAMEDTIKALEGYSAVYMSAVFTDEDGSEKGCTCWAEVNTDGTKSDSFRLDLEDGQVKWGQGGSLYRYQPVDNTVYIQHGQQYSALPIWPDRNLLYKLKEMSKDWQVSYGKDASTGRDRVFLTCRLKVDSKPFSLWLEFDRETNLLVRCERWSNYDFEGQSDLVINEITYYRDVPDDTFDFEIPEGARVIEE